MNRRALMTTTALIAPAAALAACAAISTATSTTTEAGINQAIAIAQGILNYIGPVVPLVAAFIPGASSIVPLVMAGISTASGLLNTLSNTMAAATAQPIVSQVAMAIGGVLTAGDQAVALITNPTQQAQAQAILAAARGELALLAQLATNIQTVITSPPVASAVFRRGIVVPPIFIRTSS